MRRIVLVPALIIAALAAAPPPAAADTLFGGTFGIFIPRGEDGRATGDVLTETFGFRNGFRTLWDDVGDTEPIKLFSGPAINGEVLFGLGDFVEAGVGIGYYSKERDSFYTEFEDIDGTEIADMVATAKRIAAEGFPVMPHFPARSIPDRATLADWIARYRG